MALVIEHMDNMFEAPSSVPNRAGPNPNPSTSSGPQAIVLPGQVLSRLYPQSIPNTLGRGCGEQLDSSGRSELIEC